VNLTSDVIKIGNRENQYPPAYLRRISPFLPLVLCKADPEKDEFCIFCEFFGFVLLFFIDDAKIIATIP